jgi:hypothetical protein
MCRWVFESHYFGLRVYSALAPPSAIPGHEMRCVRTPTSLAIAAAAVAVLGVSAPTAAAQTAQNPPACESATPPAVQFVRLPDRIPYGQLVVYGFETNAASTSNVYSLVELSVFDDLGERLYRDSTHLRGYDLYNVRIYVAAKFIRIRMRYSEGALDGSTCLRTVEKKVVGFRDGPRYDNFVSRAGSQRRSHSFPVGAPLSFVFTDRFSIDNPYRLCWQPLGKRGERTCRKHRSGEARKPDTLLARAPLERGRWIATWRSGGLIVASWTFTIR